MPAPNITGSHRNQRSCSSSRLRATQASGAAERRPSVRGAPAAGPTRAIGSLRAPPEAELVARSGTGPPGRLADRGVGNGPHAWGIAPDVGLSWDHALPATGRKPTASQ